MIIEIPPSLLVASNFNFFGSSCKMFFNNFSYRRCSTVGTSYCSEPNNQTPQLKKSLTYKKCKRAYHLTNVFHHKRPYLKVKDLNFISFIRASGMHKHKVVMLLALLSILLSYGSANVVPYRTIADDISSVKSDISRLFLTTNKNAKNFYGNPSKSATKQRRCEPITIPLCQRIGYNMTNYPNGYGHERQEEAGLEVHQFYPLVEVNCYKHLKFFLCSLYTPICQIDYELSLMPCQEVCLEARKKCSPIMQQYGFRWPETLDCKRLPKMSEQETTGVICAAPPDTLDYISTTAVIPVDNKFDLLSKKIKIAEENQSHNSQKNNEQIPPAFPPMVGIDVVDAQCECKCAQPFYSISSFRNKNGNSHNHLPHQLYRRVQNISNCVYSCHSEAIHSEQNRAFLNTWILVWSGICLALSIFTVLTFLTDMNRFPYPERPIFFLSICQLMVSLGFLLRVFYGHENVACNGGILKSLSGFNSLINSFSFSFSFSSNHDNSILDAVNKFDANSQSEIVCVTVFVLIYYFGMAAATWWVVLSLSWVLAAVPHWSTEWIAKYSTYFHLFSWLVPGVQTALVFFYNAIDGDPISGICYVGNTDVGNLRNFLLVPLVLYFLVGVCFLSIGFLNLWGIRSNLKKTHPGVDKTSKLTQLMSKIGIFSVLYTVPAIFVILVLFYEQHYRNLWEQSQLCPCAQQVENHSSTVLLFTLIKTASMLVVGWTSGVWILSAKTLQSWRRFFSCSTSDFCCNRETRRRRRQGYFPAVNRLSGSGCGGMIGGATSHHPMHQSEDKMPIYQQYQSATLPYTAAAAVAEQTLNRHFQKSHIIMNNNNKNNSNNVSPFHLHHNHLHRSVFGGGDNCVSPITFAKNFGTLRHCGGRVPEKV